MTAIYFRLSSESMAAKPSSCAQRALLIGNSNYAAGKELNSCRKDVEDIEEKLTNIGFDVIPRYDLTHENMKNEITEFKNKINKNDLVVFFFSGHGLQRHQRSYLIGVNQDPSSNVPIRPENYVCVQSICDSMVSESSPFAAIFLLDCCRSYPDETKDQDESNTFDLVKQKEHTDYIIVFACGPNQIALGVSPDEEHSLFTYFLLKYIDKPSLDVGDMMRHVCAGVAKCTKNKIYVHQEIVLKKKVYLNGARNGKNIL